MFTRNDVAYTVLNRLETALRAFLYEQLSLVHGADWWKAVPGGVQTKSERRALENGEDQSDPGVVIDYIDFYDLCEIAIFKPNWPIFKATFSDTTAFQAKMRDLTTVRNKVMHNRVVHSMELTKLRVLAFEIASTFAQGADVLNLLDKLDRDPDSVVVPVPAEFLSQPEQTRELENIPEPDYEQLFGRETEINEVKKLLTGKIHRVVTITGSGGIGKSSLAIEVARRLWAADPKGFKSIIWVSAKKQELTVTGIESLGGNRLNSYDDLLDTMLTVLKQDDLLERPTDEKSEAVMLLAESEPILLVVDNMETIHDPQIVECIKEFPPPSKVLITSRLGLGEVEKRYPLSELKAPDARILARAVARELKVGQLATAKDEVLERFVKAADYVPLAIKYMVGQVSLGSPVEDVIRRATNPTGELVQFCFDNVFHMLSEPAQKVLCAIPTFHEPPSKTSLEFVVGLDSNLFEEAVRDLVVAALTAPDVVRDTDGSLQTIYKVPAMTHGYAQNQLDAHPDWKRFFQSRQSELIRLKQAVQAANEEYRYSLRNMGATTEREMIAAFRAQSALQAYQDGDYAGAVKGFEEATAVAAMASIYKLWAWVEDKERHDVQVDKLMGRATTLDAENPSVWTMWGNMLRFRNPRKAKECLLRALGLDETDSRTLHSLAMTEMALENYPEASGYLERIPLTGANLRDEGYVRDALAQNYLRWGRKLMHERNPAVAATKLERALQECTKGLVTDQGSPHLKNTLRRILHLKGQLLNRSNRYPEALDILKQALFSNPQGGKERDHNAYCYFEMAKAARGIGHISSAKEYCSKAQQLAYYPEMKSKFSVFARELETLGNL